MKKRVKVSDADLMSVPDASKRLIAAGYEITLGSFTLFATKGERFGTMEISENNMVDRRNVHRLEER